MALQFFVSTADDAVGSNGDYGLLLQSRMYIGPKAGGSWSGVARYSSIGPSGPSFIYGKGAPDNSVGSDGQVYIDQSTFNAYGPKASGVWGGVTKALVGPQGIQGIQGAASTVAGPKGDKGDTGTKGDQGIQGLQGLTGNTGSAGLSVLSGSGAPASTLGATGQPAYIDTTAWAGYGAKTGAGWPTTPTSLIGPKGDQGLQGIQGQTGPAAPGLYKGTGLPSATNPAITQVDGSFYIRTDVTPNILYGPRLNGAWDATTGVNTGGAQTQYGYGPPAASLGSVGDVYYDLYGVFWPPKQSGGWTLTPINIVGPPGPSMQVQPSLGNSANTFGPACVSNAVSYAAGVYQQMQVPGLTGQPQAFIPPQNSLLTGVQITNYGATNATAYFYLADASNNVIQNINSGNGVASGTVTNFAFTSPVTLTAGKTYYWMATRAAAGTITANVNPIYTVPSTGPGIGFYIPANNLTAGTAITLSTTQQYLGAAGLSGQQWYYRNPYASWMYGGQALLQGSGSVQLVLYNTTSSVAVWTSPSYTLSSTSQTVAFGPFAVSATYIPANANICWAVVGSGTLTNVSIATQVGM